MRQCAGIIALAFLLAVSAGAAGPQAQGGAPLKWFKGNTHTQLRSTATATLPRTTWCGGTASSGTTSCS